MARAGCLALLALGLALLLLPLAVPRVRQGPRRLLPLGGLYLLVLAFTLGGQQAC